MELSVTGASGTAIGVVGTSGTVVGVANTCSYQCWQYASHLPPPCFVPTTCESPEDTGQNALAPFCMQLSYLIFKEFEVLVICQIDSFYLTAG